MTKKLTQTVEPAKPATFADHARAYFSRPWLLETVSMGAVALSVGVAAVGVAGLVGFDSPLAQLGTFIIVAGTVLTETAATRLPVHAEARWREGSRIKAGAVGVGFAVLTVWNLMAGHMGMVAINEAGVADKRQPLVEAAAEADAARETAEEALANFDAETERQGERMASVLRGAFENGYVTSGARAARDDATARTEQRQELAAAVAVARSEDRRAEAALAAAPAGRPDHELWAFAVVLELLKGALTWFATAAAGAATVAGIAAFRGLKQKVTAADLLALPAEQRRALKQQAASIMAAMRFAEAARAAA